MESEFRNERLASAMKFATFHEKPWSDPIHPSLKHTLPKSSGCYALLSDNVILYIGKSLNLRKRVTIHLNRPGGFPINQIQFVLVPETELARYETQLITKYNPEFNNQWKYESGVVKDTNLPLPPPIQEPIKKEPAKPKTYSQPSYKRHVHMHRHH